MLDVLDKERVRRSLRVARSAGEVAPGWRSRLWHRGCAVGSPPRAFAAGSRAPPPSVPSSEARSRRATVSRSAASSHASLSSPGGVARGLPRAPARHFSDQRSTCKADFDSKARSKPSSASSGDSRRGTDAQLGRPERRAVIVGDSETGPERRQGARPVPRGETAQSLTVPGAHALCRRTRAHAGIDARYEGARRGRRHPPGARHVHPASGTRGSAAPIPPR